MGPAPRGAGSNTVKLSVGGNKRSRSTPTPLWGEYLEEETTLARGAALGPLADGARPRVGWSPCRPRSEKASSSKKPLDTPEVSSLRSTGSADLEDTTNAEILDRILRGVLRADEQRRASKNIGRKRNCRMRQSLDYVRWTVEKPGKSTYGTDEPLNLEQLMAIQTARLKATEEREQRKRDELNEARTRIG
ncbi:hypothetical protein KM043_013967 [Ampulex compressa]|nr:hypothetical protein KM043_013967 [Ampulex compressa]